MSLEEMQKEIAEQQSQETTTGTLTDTQDATTVDSLEPTDRGRGTSVHNHHPSVALLQKAENHVERRKQALMAHAGYQVDPRWWDSKLKLIKKAQAAHHKVVNSISVIDHPEISISQQAANAGVAGLAELRYDSSEDENEHEHDINNNNNNINNIDDEKSTIGHSYNVSGTEIYKGDPITPRLSPPDNDTDSNNPYGQHSGLRITNFDPNELSETERQEFEQQRKQLEKVLKDFDLLLKNYEHATANLEVLSKIAFDKQSRQNELKELDDKFTSQLKAQDVKIGQINNSIDSIVTSINDLKDSQSNTLNNIESQIREANNLSNKIIERETVSQSNSSGNLDAIAAQQKQDKTLLFNRMDEMVNTMKQSFGDLTSQINNMSQSVNKNITTLSKEVEDVATAQQELRQRQLKGNESTGGASYQNSTQEDLPLLSSGTVELEPKQYVLKRLWCCGLVCCARACGIGCEGCC